MKLPRRQFLHLAAGAAALPALSGLALRKSYPAKPVRLVVQVPGRQRAGHHRPRDRSKAVGAAGAAHRHRQPPGRQRQHRDRIRNALAGGRLCAAVLHVGERHQRDAVRQSAFQFHARHRAGGVHWPHPAGDGSAPVGPGEDRPGVHRLRQGQSRQDQHGVERQRHAAPRRRRAVQDDGRRQYRSTWPTAASRWRGPIC